VQEETKEYGCWNFLYHRLRSDFADKCELDYAGRPESASPAVGSYKYRCSSKEVSERWFK